jgi:hypothetical protein
MLQLSCSQELFMRGNQSPPLLRCAIIASLLIAVCLPLAPARAQARFDHLLQPPIDLVREAFAAEYGSLLVAEFAKILRESADPACLAAKGIDPAQLGGRGKDILVRYGAQMIQVFLDATVIPRYEAGLAARAGPNAKAEIARLRNDPEVQKALNLDRPRHLAGVANRVADNFDRFALLNRIKLSRQLSPLATGDDRLLNADPSDASEEAVERFVAQSKSKQLAKYMALTTMAQEALVAAGDMPKLLMIGPTQMFRGAEKELADLCISARR